MNNVKMFIDNNVVSKHQECFMLGKKALIVTGKSSAKISGALDDVINVLNKNKIEYLIYDKISQNPIVDTCFDASHFAKDCDFVIGIGGGSSLDAAKAIALMIPNQDLNEETLYLKQWKNNPLDIVLVGTTSGTGSEVTAAAVLTDSNLKKHSIHDDSIYAKFSLGDVKYTFSLNKDFTISTALDALSHATESYFSNNATDESRYYSVKCIKEMFNSLINIKENEISLKQREDLYYGSIDGGYAIDLTGTTFAHHVGYYFTENYHIPHGIACAMFLDDVIDFQISSNPEYARKFFNDINLTDDEFKQFKKLIPENHISLPIETIDKISKNLENNRSIKNTYGHMNINDIRNILIKKFMK